MGNRSRARRDPAPGCRGRIIVPEADRSRGLNGGPLMRVAYDVISAGGGLGPGSGAMVLFYRGALGALAARPEIDAVVALTQPWNGRLGIPDHPKLTVAPCRGLPRSRIGRVAYEQIVLPGAVARQRPDLLVSGHNTTPLLRRGPSLVILHSIGHLFFPPGYSPLPLRYLEHALPRSLRPPAAG